MSIKPLKRFGQNFLRDPNTAIKIASALSIADGQTVVEIGPGEGALTKHLVERTPNLTVVEVDERAVDVLRDRFPSLDVRHCDVLEFNWQELAIEKGGKIAVIGNLPYNITSPILFGLLAASSSITEIVAMVQLEVAQRIVAGIRTKAYGSLSVGIQLQTHAELLFKVSRNVFHPKPNVTSAVIRLRVREDAPSQAALDRIRGVVRTAFNQRRKTLRNSISALLPERSGEAAVDGTPAHIFENRFAGRRAEELTPADFIELSQLIDVMRV